LKPFLKYCSVTITVILIIAIIIIRTTVATELVCSGLRPSRTRGDVRVCGYVLISYNGAALHRTLSCFPNTTVQWLRLALSDDRLGVALPSPEVGNRSSFQNFMFPSYLESV
jgi:hypothetical protein